MTLTKDTHENFGRSRALILTLILMMIPIGAPAQEFQTRSGLAFGLTSSNWDRQATLGYVFQHSEHLSTYAAIDVGGGQTATQAQTMITQKINRWTYLGLLIGPEVLVLQENPSIEEKLTYFNVATAAIISRDISKDFSIFAAAHYIHTDAPVTHYKITFGAVIWFP